MPAGQAPGQAALALNWPKPVRISPEDGPGLHFLEPDTSPRRPSCTRKRP